MSTVEVPALEGISQRELEENDDQASVKNRIRTVRRQQGLSLRSVARMLGVDVAKLKQQEQESADLKISDLYRWQEALDVPVADLLVEPGMPLSRPVMERARLLRLMKTAVGIYERASTPALERMARMLLEQFTEIMPELAEVSGWPTVGQRRSMDEYGRVVERRMSEDALYHYQTD